MCASTVLHNHLKHMSYHYDEQITNNITQNIKYRKRKKKQQKIVVIYGVNSVIGTLVMLPFKLGLMPTPPCVGYGIRRIQISSVERCVHRSHSSSHTIVLQHSVQVTNAVLREFDTVLVANGCLSYYK